MLVTVTHTFDELGKQGNHFLTADFDVDIYGGSNGSYFEPPEPPEVDFIQAFIEDCDIEFDDSWHDVLAEVALDLAEGAYDTLVVKAIEAYDADHEYYEHDWEEA